MAERFVSERDLRFLLYEVFDAEALCTYPYFEEHSRETFDMVVETAFKMGRDLLFPYFQEMDKIPPELTDGEVRVHPMVKEFMLACGEGGWIAANAPFEMEGQQLPILVTSICRFIFSAANYSASVYPMLTTGAAHLIESFGSDGLIQTFIPKMHSGQWQGTMALTEPQAGSSLSDITTQATPNPTGEYRIRGQKIFISAGDHNGVENVVHLMLARIKGAPPGVKGISLFVVPKKRIAENGDLVPNDVHVAGIYHKLGYRGTPLTQLSLGENEDCHGYLVGEPHQGLSYMFQMMNAARIDVGLGAAAIASAAYHASLEYARQRPQGRLPGAKDPTLPQIPIIQHADVKRMLLFQRAVVEGSLSLILQCGRYEDMKRVSDGAQAERYGLLLDLLTGVAKSYPSEMGIWSISQGLQILGGYGFCDEFPLEQYYRDARIHPIHEGTTGIQGMDLLGRKVMMNGGEAFRLYLEKVRKTITDARETEHLKTYAEALDKALTQLGAVTGHLKEIAAEGATERFLADATVYLEYFGIVAIAWQWLKQGCFIVKGMEAAASPKEQRFYQGKFYTLRFFFNYELPKTEGLARSLTDAEGLAVEMAENFFTH